MFGYKYSAKPRPCSPKARAHTSKLESKVEDNFAMLVALDSPIDDTSKICFQTTTVAINGFLVHLKVMYGRVESKRETWSDFDGSKDYPKYDDLRLSIGELRSTIGGFW